MVIEEDKDGNVASPELDPILLEGLERIRQEIEDMAYERLRSVLSDFSLQDPELSERVESHKLYIKEKAHEIVKVRLEEMKLLISEAEFWCLCGKYERADRRRTPLIENIIRPQKPQEPLQPQEPPKHTTSEAASSLGSVKSTSLVSDLDQSAKVSRAAELIQMKPASEHSYRGEGWSTDEAEFDLKDNTITYHKSKMMEQPKVDSFVIQVPDILQTSLAEMKAHESDKDLAIEMKYDAQISKRKRGKRKDDRPMDSRGFETPVSLSFTEKPQAETSTALNLLLAEEIEQGDRIQQTEEMELTNFEEEMYQEMYQGDRVQQTEEMELTNFEETLGEEVGGEEYLLQFPPEQSTSVEADIESLEGFTYLPDEDIQQVLDTTWIANILDDLIDKQFTRAIEDLERAKESARSQKLSGLSKLLGNADIQSAGLAPEATIDQFTSKDMQYLQEVFGDCLEVALAELTTKKPSSPIAYLAQYLMFYKRDKLFDRYKRDDNYKVNNETERFNQSLGRLYEQKSKLMRYGEEIQEKILHQGLHDEYRFVKAGKISMRRGRRLRHAIVTICDKFMAKSPLSSLTRKIRKLQTFKNILRYIYVLLRELKLEMNYLKIETITKVHAIVINFLGPILPELVGKPSVTDLNVSEITKDSIRRISFDSYETVAIDEECEDYEMLHQTVSIKSSKKSDDSVYVSKNFIFPFNEGSQTKFRGKPNPYPCVDGDEKVEYLCKTRLDTDEVKRKCLSMHNIILSLLYSSDKPLTLIRHINKAQSCAMCIEVGKIIENIRSREIDLKTRLVNFISREYINIGISSMFDIHHTFVRTMQSQDEEILKEVIDLLDCLIEFQDPSDALRIRETMMKYFEQILQNQQLKLERFRNRLKNDAVRELEERMRTLMDMTQKDPCDAPCTCAEDTKKETGSENSWSDDEEGFLDSLEQERLNKAIYRVSQTVETIMIREPNVGDIQHILEAFITRGHRPKPYLSKRAKKDFVRLRKLVAGLFGSSHCDQDQEQIPDLDRDDYVCTAKPCVCKFVLQASWTMLAIHSRMLRQFDSFRLNERNMFELEIMKMFASFVDGLTVEKIQRQPLCSGIKRF